MTVHVLLCSHNGSQFIAEQLDSIFRQTRPVDRIWVHDFASTDDTCAIVDRLAAQQPPGQLHLVREPDAPGAALSFFRAIQAVAAVVAPDDLVFFCDQDDWWQPDKVDTVWQHFAQSQAKQPGLPLALFHDVAVVDHALRPLRPTYYTGNPFQVPRDLAADRLILANPVIGHTLGISGSLLTLVARLPQPGRFLMHDWATVLVASRVGKIEFIARPLSLYRQHAHNVLGAYGRRSTRQVLQRTLAFSAGVTRQALAFSHLQLPGSAVPGPRIDRCLARVHPSRAWLAFPALAAWAAWRGPTLKRRLLALVLLLTPLSRQARPLDDAGIPTPGP